MPPFFTETPRVLVLQMGARLHYAVPAIYARARALQAMYTDACASIGVLSLVRRWVPQRVRTEALQRLLARRLPEEIPVELVRVETLASLAEVLHVRFSGKPRGISTPERLRRRILRRQFDGANCLYCLDSGDLDLIKAGHAAGLAILYEQVICPSVGRILREERSMFRGIEPQDSENDVERGIAQDTEIFRLADTVICGSEFVREDVLALAPTARAAVTPYGLSEEWLSTPAATIPGRILFVGSVGLRKGNHYLAEATRLLRTRGVKCDVRVIGPYDKQAVARPEFEGPTYVGQIPRDAVRVEFAQADVFVLPALAEGSALVVMEALACGVPVVTTPNAGSQVRDGKEGFIVPIRDAGMLAERLEHIISDRPLRERLSRQARERAKEASWQTFGNLLMANTRFALQRARERARMASQEQRE